MQSNKRNAWINRVRSVRWCYDFELAKRNQKNDLLMLTTGIFPLLQHKGRLLLTDSGIELFGKSNEKKEEIPFDLIETIYLGYDDLYPPRLSKNFGYAWSPLRITLKNGAQIYLIIYGSMGILIRNKAWFEYLKNTLA